MASPLRLRCRVVRRDIVTQNNQRGHSSHSRATVSVLAEPTYNFNELGNEVGTTHSRFDLDGSSDLTTLSEEEDQLVNVEPEPGPPPLGPATDPFQQSPESSMLPQLSLHKDDPWTVVSAYIQTQTAWWQHCSPRVTAFAGMEVHLNRDEGGELEEQSGPILNPDFSHTSPATAAVRLSSPPAQNLSLEYLQATHVQCLQEIQELDSARLKLGGAFTLFVRYRIARQICLAEKLDFHNRNVSVLRAWKGIPFSLTPAQVVAVTGRSMGTLANHKALLDRASRKYEGLVGRSQTQGGLDADDLVTYHSLAAFHLPVKDIVSLPIQHRPLSILWTFQQLDSFLH